MSFARVRLVIAAVAFIGWLTWLGFAVMQRGTVPLVSRGQITGATYLVVAEVTRGGDGLPAPTAKVTEVLRGAIPAGEIEVLNLPSARAPGAEDSPEGGLYLLPLTGDGKTYRIAGLPRSPGYEPATPARPVIYPWENDDVRKQLAGLGLRK
jgi:hypothetical protein